MLDEKNAIATVAVRDLGIAGKFYRDKLGLKQVGAEGEEAIVLRSGNSTLNVYRSQYAGTNQATAVTWIVGDRIDDIARELKAKGVACEHYDGMPGMTREGDVHVGNDMRVAWFKDPDGNILNIVSR